MKKTIFYLVSASLFFLCLGLYSFQSTNSDIEKYPTIAIGSKIPSGKGLMKGVDGKESDLISHAKSNGLLVIFSSNTCPFVLKWEGRYPLIKSMCDRFNIGMVMINSNEMKRDGDDSYELMQKKATDKKYTWPYLLDKNSVLANSFGAKTTPHAFLFDKSYNLVYKGAIDDNYESAAEVKAAYLLDAIGAIAAQTKIDPVETKPVGCSIKRKLD